MTTSKALLRQQAYAHIQEIESEADMMVYTYYCEKAIKERMRSSNKNTDNPLTWRIAEASFRFVLEDKLSPKDALIQSSELFGKDFDDVWNVKSKNSKGMNKAIIDSMREHLLLKDMAKHGHYSIRTMKRCISVWQMLETLYTYRSNYEQTLFNKRLEKDVEDLKMKVETLEQKMEMIINQNRMGVPTDKELATKMLENGYNKEQIAKHLNKNVRTIRRWLN